MMLALSPKAKRNERKKEVQGWLMTSPYLIFTLIFFLIPLVWSIFLIFQRWDLIAPTAVFIGLANFKEALTSSRIWQAFLSTYKFMLLFVPLGDTREKRGLITLLLLGAALGRHAGPVVVDLAGDVLPRPAEHLGEQTRDRLRRRLSAIPALD